MKRTNATHNQRKSFDLLIYADLNSGEAIALTQTNAKRDFEWRSSNAKYFQSRSFMYEVLTLSHLTSQCLILSYIAPTILYTHTQIALFALPSLCSLRTIFCQRNNKVLGFETEKFMTI